MTAPAPGALSGRTALITGAVGVLGRAVAYRFACEGARLVVSDLDQRATAELAAQLSRDTGAQVYPIAMDVRDSAAVDDAAQRVSDDFGVCDALVINAGVLVLGPALQLTREQWDLVLGVNLTGAFTTATAFARHLLAAGRPGTIAFSSSLFGVRGGRGNAAYSATKFGVIGLAQSMAAELAAQRIRVNAVCPGQIDTEMLERLFVTRAASASTTPEHERAQFCRRIPLGELGSPEDVAKAFLYLSSAASSYMTGQHIVLDGGWQVS